MKSSTVVIGLGRSGIGAANLLNNENNHVIVFEKDNNDEICKSATELNKIGIKVKINTALEFKNFEPLLPIIESIIVSPSIPWDHPTLKQLRSIGIQIKGEISLAWERMNNLKWIGITGTNGKTTVTHMINHILRSNGHPAEMAGNVGRSAADLALEIKHEKIKPEYLVMELSSYQLEAATEISPYIGIWTNLTEDHLERHKTMENYSNIKKNMIDNSKIRIYNADDGYLRENYSRLNPGIWVTSLEKRNKNSFVDYWINKDGFVCTKGIEIFHTSSLKLRGKHNLQNMMIAVATAHAIGIKNESIKQSILSFEGVAHRLERIYTFKDIEIYNDSKATNFASGVVGLNSIEAPAILLAGGKSKEGDPSDWIKALKKQTIGIILFGESAQLLIKSIKQSGYKGKVECCKDLAQAVTLGMKMALEKKSKTLLLSPVCASFDQYKSFEDRGNHFRELIKSYLEIV